MKQKFVTFMLALLATAALFAQNKTVRGNVSDAQGPAIGVSVMEKGTRNGVITDLDGNYAITVKPGATLVFTSIGYAAQEIAVDGQSVINVILKEDAEFLDEVVVVGYGTMKKSDLAGAVLTVTGKDLDLVDNIVVGGEGLSDFDREATGTEISFPVPEKAVEGDVVLIMVNRKQVSVPFTLVKPEVTGFSANPAAAGSPITIEGTDLDLVAAVTFGGGVKVNVEATETAITVSVPTTAESGDLILNLKNGTTLSAGKLEVDKPVACYILTDLSEMEIHGGSVVTVEVANESVLTGVQVNGEAVQYILNGNALFICMPAMAGSGTVIRLESSNGAVEYTVEAIPATIIETVVMNQERNLGSWANEEAGGAFRIYKADLAAAGIKPGKTLRFYVSQFAFAQLQINDANWGQISCPKFDEGAAPAIIDVVMDADFCTTVMETSDGWGDTAMVVQGEGLIVTKVTLK